MNQSQLQCKAMLDHMKKHGSITTKDIQVKLGICSPTWRWHELKEAGYQFGWRWTKMKTRYGERKVKVKEYHITRIPPHSIYED